MTGGLDFAALMVVVAVAFGTPVLLGRWTRFAADWCWLLAIRGPLVAGVSLASLIAVTAGLHGLFGFRFMSPLAVLAAILVTPEFAVRLSDLAAKRLAGGAASGGSFGFIFEQRRREQREAYLAPPTDQ